MRDDILMEGTVNDGGIKLFRVHTHNTGTSRRKISWRERTARIRGVSLPRDNASFKTSVPDDSSPGYHDLRPAAANFLATRAEIRPS